MIDRRMDAVEMLKGLIKERYYEELGDDMDESNDAYFEPVSVDTEAQAQASYDEGYRIGLEKGESIGYIKGYAKRGEDVIDIIRAIGSYGTELSGEELKQCLMKMIEK